MARSRRYIVSDDQGEVVLQLNGEYGQNDEPSTHVFWCPASGGYVREITRDRPGTLGRQVCESLFGLGSTLSARPDTLADKIRHLAKKHCDAIDSDKRRL